MIFNEKAFIRHLKRHKKSGIIYGRNEDNYLFGAGVWRAAINENKVSMNIFGELMKLTSLYPQKGYTFECVDGELAQYRFNDPMEWETPQDLIPLSVYDIVIEDSYRVLADIEGNIRLIPDVFVQMLDKEAVTDEEYMFKGPFYSESEEMFVWYNDSCIMKVLARDQEAIETSEKVKALEQAIAAGFSPSCKYTFHGEAENV